jgi:formiminoglutamase
MDFDRIRGCRAGAPQSAASGIPLDERRQNLHWESHWGPKQPSEANMDRIIVCRREDLASRVRLREGERKMGEKVWALKPVERLDDMAGYVEKGVRFALLGIPESIGPRANYGRIGAEHAWEAFLDSFLNMQSNRFLTGNEILCLGHIDTGPLQQEASRLDASRPERVEDLRALCARLDEMVAPVIEAIVQSGLTPVVIGGGHNNAYPILKGTSRGLKVNGGIQCVNCDPHADFRPMEGRHSGNGFSYAYSEAYLNRYFVFGLHESCNSERVMGQIEGNSDIGYSPFDDMNDVSSHLEMALRFLNPSPLPVGVEVDLDSISDMPSSAMTPSGFRVEEARQFVRTMASKLNTAYLHLPEGAPGPDLHNRITVGKTLAYLVLDYVKMSLGRSGRGDIGHCQ